MSRAVNAACEVDEIEHCWIPMVDGIRLAARLWLPRTDGPVPAIVEYIPYRKGDMVRPRDERNHPYFAAHGYACLRIDMRGSGDSEGHMPDMYATAELDDIRQAIEWIAAQDWCDGAVGMFGTSWGGTASLQAACGRPAALKAVIAVCATHDRYEDDIHHKGGCLLTDSIEWGATLPAILAAPPAAATVGAGWRELWRGRLERLAFPLEPWIREEARTPYWYWGSVAHHTLRIDCPVLAIGGWSDRYSTSVMALVEKRPDLVWGIVGPWGHHYPDVAHPGPGIGFQQEALKWWDHWLKDAQGCVDAWPRLRLWLREFDPPLDVLETRNGSWIELPDRAGALTEPMRLHPSGTSLDRLPAQAAAEALIPQDLRIGRRGGDTGYFGRFGGLPIDQAEDDIRSLTFETSPLEADVLLMGSAEFTAELICDQPVAQIVLRLSDVAPSGQAARVALAPRNLALDDTLSRLTKARPGSPQAIRVPFHNKAYRFRKGHRIRLAISSSYWPMIWPAPGAARISLRLGATSLMLPVLKDAPEPLGRPFATPLAEPAPIRFDRISSPQLVRFCREDPDGTLVSGWSQPFTSLRFHHTGVTFGFATEAIHTISPDCPESATSCFKHRLCFERPDGVVEVTGAASMRATADTYQVDGAVTVTEDGIETFSRRWSPSITRRMA